ncbi:hypothetical protein [Motilimonas cestriensis]|uniref:hypothetical protein n=1 Tax=Motilimonas cestriensis TaxID=2742685 RepID=UPI003DA207BB
MKLSFEPFVGFGPLKFGMAKDEVVSLAEEVEGIGNCTYQDGKLSAFLVYPDEVDNLVLLGDDVTKAGKLEVALNLAYQSGDYGQAQGGSLYFMDLGCAILQFESDSRGFLFFSSDYHTGEPLRKMTPGAIETYYEDNFGDE